MKKGIIFIGLIILTVCSFAQIITPIGNIQDSLDVYEGQIVTIEGVITIGAGVLHSERLQAYIQDESEKGLQIFDFELTTEYLNDIIRGNKLRITGEIDEYNGMIEIGDFSYQIVETGIDISEYTIDMSISQVLNGSEFVGTFISLSGILVYLPYYAGGGWNMMISDESNDIIIRIWDSTGIEVSNFEVGQILDINGIIGIFNNQAQILPGYPEDISIDVNIEDDQIINSDHLCLLNNYPNPFNPETTIKFSVKESETAKLSIYNMKGQNVKSYPVFNSGNHSALWDGLDNYGNKISSGVYLYKVQSGSTMQVRRMLMLK